MNQGISAAFQQANAARTLGDTTLNLIALDDQFNATLAIRNTYVANQSYPNKTQRAFFFSGRERKRRAQ